MSRYLLVLPSEIEGHDDILTAHSVHERDALLKRHPRAKVIDVSDGPPRLRLGYWKDDA